MQQESSNHHAEHTSPVNPRMASSDRSLQLTLWLCWTIAVVIAGFLQWHADQAALLPFNPVALSLRCLLVGVVGLTIMSKIEMWLEPWRF